MFLNKIGSNAFFSPTGNRILYCSYVKRKSSFHSMKLDGTDDKKIARGIRPFYVVAAPNKQDLVAVGY